MFTADSARAAEGFLFVFRHLLFDPSTAPPSAVTVSTYATPELLVPVATSAVVMGEAEQMLRLALDVKHKPLQFSLSLFVWPK